jgi:hypothetical protein
MEMTIKYIGRHLTNCGFSLAVKQYMDLLLMMFNLYWQILPT